LFFIAPCIIVSEVTTSPCFNKDVEPPKVSYRFAFASLILRFYFSINSLIELGISSDSLNDLSIDLSCNFCITLLP